MNNFKKISAVILALCTAATVFCSCGNKGETNTTTDNDITEIITEKKIAYYQVTDSEGNVSVSASEKIVTIPVTKKENISDSAPEKNSFTTKISSAVTQITSVGETVKTPATTKKSDVKTTKPTVITAIPTTKKPVVNDIINEKAVGIFLLSKSDPVSVGNHATIFVQGTPGKTYSIEFYETPTSTAKLENKKADANGFVSWSFEIRNTCNLGKRKIIIKENNSDNYIETSITVK